MTMVNALVIIIMTRIIINKNTDLIQYKALKSYTRKRVDTE